MQIERKRSALRHNFYTGYVETWESIAKATPLPIPVLTRHVDRPTVAQTPRSAMEWLWKGYPIPEMALEASIRGRK
jgi:hypothetical protein